MLNKKIVEMFKDLRKQKGISQAKLAKAAGVSVRTVKYWESGQQGMSIDSADAVAKALGVTITLGKE